MIHAQTKDNKKDVGYLTVLSAIALSSGIQPFFDIRLPESDIKSDWLQAEKIHKAELKRERILARNRRVNK
ncbi:MAG: hypothetical protein KAJ03_05005 [Gammaproteobacteria bacterium]|nr:hypothetical protein [Gammaproteobacteria bacterium]